MFRQTLDRIAPGESIAKTLYTERGEVLVAAGVQLTPAYLDALRRRGVTTVYVADGIADDVVPHEPVSEKLRARVTTTVTTMFEQMGQIGSQQAADGRPATVDQAAQRLSDGELSPTAELISRLYTDVDALIGEILAGDAIGGLESLKSHNAYTFQHSVDVAILGVLIARRAKIVGEQLTELALGCLLHDLGKTYVEAAILDKPGKLTPEELGAIRQHPLMGFELIRRMKLRTILPAHVAFQHHERQDGGGYPQGLTGTNRLARTSAERFDARRMILIAEIAAVADVYSAITSDRPYRAALTVERASRELERMAGRHLNREVVAALLSTVPVFPVGHWIECDGGPYTGWRGIVSDVSEAALHRPRVRLLVDARLERVADPVEVEMRTVDDWRLRSLPAGVHPLERVLQPA